MTYRIEIIGYKDVTPNDLLGVKIRFYLSITQIHQGIERDIKSNHTLDVEISDDLIRIWNLGSQNNPIDNINLIKILLTFVEKNIRDNIENNNVDEHINTIKLYINNSPEICPYEPDKIPNPKGYSFDIVKRRIGF